MFYKSIASVYDYIFPQNKAQLNFINQVSPIHADDHILEIGCATGSLTALLANEANHVIGLDLDETLLLYAEKKYPNLNFIHKNMMLIRPFFDQNSQDKVISFGNTLVHLKDEETILDFFIKVYDILKDGGHFIVQIIHYDRILDQNIQCLSTIQNDHITFKRYYDIKDEHLDFRTELQIHETNQIYHNIIPLVPIRKNKLQQMLTAIGFKNIEFFGDLSGKPLDANDVSLLFICQKSF